MPFGEFLMKTGRVEKGDLIRALRLQRVRQTALPELAVRHGLMAAEILVDVIRDIEEGAGIDFIESALRCRHLTIDQVLELKELQTTTRPRVGELLVELKILTDALLIKSLSEFGAYKQLHSFSV